MRELRAVARGAWPTQSHTVTGGGAVYSTVGGAWFMPDAIPAAAHRPASPVCASASARRGRACLRLRGPHPAFPWALETQLHSFVWSLDTLLDA